MANTLPDNALTGDWVSANQLSGLAVGSGVIIQNVPRTSAQGYIRVAIAASKPTGEAFGPAIGPWEQVEVSAGENEVWLHGVGHVSIQGV
jgi:hypothetical protein